MKKTLFLKKNKIWRVCLIFFIIIFSQLNVISLVWAGEGKTTANFLLENLNAKEVARGGIGTVRLFKFDAQSSNPAGSAQILQPEINFSYVSSFDQSIYGGTHFAQSFSNKRQTFRTGIGAGITYYSAGNIDINYSNGTTQSFSAEKSYAAGITVSGIFFNWLAIGLSPKMIRSTIVDQYTGTSYALDAGILFYPFPKHWSERVNLGAAIKNLGSKLTYKSKEHDLPLIESLGLGLDLWDKENYGALSVGAQGEKTLGENIKYRVGGDYGFGGGKGKRTFFLRGGYRMDFADEDYSLGIGITEANLTLDYAYVNRIELEKTHRLTLIFHFGKMKDEKYTPRADYELLDKTIKKEEKIELLGPIKEEKNNLIEEKEEKNELIKEEKEKSSLLKNDQNKEDYQLIR